MLGIIIIINMLSSLLLLCFSLSYTNCVVHSMVHNAYFIYSWWHLFQSVYTMYNSVCTFHAFMLCIIACFRIMYIPSYVCAMYFSLCIRSVFQLCMWYVLQPVCKKCISVVHVGYVFQPVCEVDIVHIVHISDLCT